MFNAKLSRIAIVKNAIIAFYRSAIHICFTIFLVLLYGCQSGNQGFERLPELNNPDFLVNLESSAGKKISDYLMGFNIVYPQERDEIWADGSLKKSLKDVNTSVLRYPGGTVVTFYHWDKPTGNGWMDKWDPAITTADKPASEFMDINEYMQLIRETRAMPMMGINMSSGWRFNRTDEGVNEALALMKYCKDKNFPVTYWYLDNEPYQHDANGGSKTPEQYGELINIYAEKMKAYDPDIKIVANWNAGIRNKRNDYVKLINIAGKNIDMIDVHWYWSWGNPTWEKWIEGPMKFWTGTTYIEEITDFRTMVSELGYPDIQLGSFEWNVGPAKQGDMSPAQCALIQTEMMMQFMQGGLDMAILWPLHWPSQFQARGFYNAQHKELNPVYHIFRFLGNFQGSTLLEMNILKQDPGLHLTSALSEDKETLRIMLLNKGGAGRNSVISSELFRGMKIIDAKTFTLGESHTDYQIEPAVVDFVKSESRIGVAAGAYSVVMLTLSKNQSNI